MPRRRKTEIDDEKVLPLSLPEVQLSVVNAIHRDTVDEEAVHRAVRGYQLLLHGCLLNSKSEKTRTLKDHGGYHRNVMRGVAHIFGIEKRRECDNGIIRGPFSSQQEQQDSVDISDTCTDTDEVVGTTKKRRVARTDFPVSEGLQTNEMAVTGKARETEDRIFEDKIIEDAISNLEDLEPPLPSPSCTTPPAAEPDMHIDGLTEKHREEPEPPLDIAKPTAAPSTVPFNRYKSRSQRLISRRVSQTLVGKSVPHKVDHNMEDKGFKRRAMKHAIEIPMLPEEPKTRTPFRTADMREKEIVGISDENTLKRRFPGKATPTSIRERENLGHGGEREEAFTSEFREKRVPGISTEQSRYSFEDNRREEKSLEVTTRPVPMEDAGVSADEGKVEKLSIDDVTQAIPTPLLQQISPPVTHHRVQHRKINTNAIPENFRADRIHDSQRSPPSPVRGNRNGDMLSPILSQSSSFAMKPHETIGMADMIKLPKGFTLFSNYKVVKQIQNVLLEGNWMSTNRNFKQVDFLNPYDTNNYFMIRHLEGSDHAERKQPAQWQLIYFRDLKSCCEEMKRQDPIDISRLESKSRVYIFDSTSMGTTNEALLTIFNFLNGVFRSYYAMEYNLKTPNKKDFERIKSFVGSLSTNIVYVSMPKEQSPKLSGAYLIANLSYLTTDGNIENIINIAPSTKNGASRVLNCKSGKKKRVTKKFVLTTIDAVHKYTSDYVDPLLAL